MSRTSPWKCKCQIQIKSGIKKVRKEYLQEPISLLSLPAIINSSINSHGTWGNTGGDICIFPAMCSTTYKKEIRFSGKAFDGGWVTRWWRDVGGAAENEGWTESVGEDGKVGVHEDIAVDTSRNGMLDGLKF